MFGQWRFGISPLIPGLIMIVIYNVKWSRRYRAAKEDADRSYDTDNLSSRVPRRLADAPHGGKDGPMAAARKMHWTSSRRHR